MTEIALILFIVLSAILGWKFFQLKKNTKYLRDALVEAYLKDPSEEDLVKEQFLKFVSDSREWAFEYIENVQKEISIIVNEIEPVVINRENRNYSERDSLESTYKKLKSLLPEQDN